MLFAICKDDNEKSKASVRKFLEVKNRIKIPVKCTRIALNRLILLGQEITRTGIRYRTDPRLQSMVAKLEKYKTKPSSSLESILLDFAQFRDVLSANLPLITKIFQNDLVIPEFEIFCKSVTNLYEKLKDNFNGAVGDQHFCFERNQNSSLENTKLGF